MTALLLTPVVLSCLLLAAHFLYAGPRIVALACLLAPVVLLVRKAWAARFMQLLLVAGWLVWVWTARMRVVARQETAQPWGRLALILGLVALFTLLSALVFRSRRLRDRYSG